MPLDEIYLEAHLTPRLLVRRISQQPYLSDKLELDFQLPAAESILIYLPSMMIFEPQPRSDLFSSTGW